MNSRASDTHRHRIPFERALDFANKEKITEMLYPLFVHNIGALLYHPTNQNRTNQVMAAAERRKQEQSQMRNGPGPAPAGGVLPSIQQHHHHMGLPGPQAPLPSHGGRPSLDRAHTFPTPPTSASSVIGSMGASEGYQWSQQGMSGAQGANPMSIDTSLSNAARSMPATPATTPPGGTLQSMQPYPQGTQSYDASRGVYNGSAPQQSPYHPSNNSPQDRNMYGQPNSYMKSEMGPPSGRPAGTGPTEQADVKPANGIMQPGEGVPQSAGDDEAENEAEYTHDSGAFDANRSAYNYNTSQVAPLAGDHQHLSPEMTGSPGHQAGSGRATPRTAAPPAPYYTQQAGYNTPPRVQPSSNLYNVMSNDRGPTNGAPGNDVYGSQNDMGATHMQNGYAPAPVLNGAPAPLKRGRDDDEDLSRPSSGGMDLKRRKTLIEAPMPTPAYEMNRAAQPVLARRR